MRSSETRRASGQKKVFALIRGIRRIDMTARTELSSRLFLNVVRICPCVESNHMIVIGWDNLALMS